MERTARLFRITIESLPPAPEAIIVLPDDGSAVDEEERAENHGRAVNQNQSSRSEEGLSGRAGFQVHGVTGYLQGGAGRQATHGVAEYQEFIGLAVPDSARTVNKSGLTEQGLRGRAGFQVHGVTGYLQGGAGRQETHAVAEYQEFIGRAVPHVAPAVNESGLTEQGLSGRAGSQVNSVSGDRHGRAGQQNTVLEDQKRTAAMEGGLGGLAGSQGLHTSSARRHSCAIPKEQESANRYEQYTDLYLYGRPMSDVWETLWMNSPLVLHDKELLSVRKYIATCRKNSHFGLDLTSEISSVLEQHPGPISYFRLDCCSWTGGCEKLGHWFEILSAKQVRELVVINKVLPTNTVCPVNRLQGPDLTMLCLAFMDIPSFCLGAFTYCTLDTLQIIGCTYCGIGLGSVVADCACLRCLVLGCSREDISITSQSLMSIQIWNCTASFFRIDYAPKLLILAIGIRPKEGLNSVMISAKNVEALTEISHLMLPFHDFTISSASIIEGVVALPQVRRVRLGIQMGSAHQRDGLVNVLKRMPRLTHLTILTVEDCATDEEFDGAVVASALGSASVLGSASALGSLSCVRMCLHSLTVDGFRGGRAEVAVIASILSNAGKLAEVMLEPYSFIAVEAANEAAKKLDRCPRASIGCRISVRCPD